MKSFFKMVLRTVLLLRIPLFFVMFWLRGVVLFFLKLGSLVTLLVWLFSWYAFPDKPQMVWGFAAASLICFVLGWGYDLILMVVAPQELTTLYL